jgi:hypothetical protein
MNAKETIDRLHKTYPVSRETMRSEVVISKEVLDTAEFNVIENIVLGKLIATLDLTLYGDAYKMETKTEEITVPRSWIDHLKQAIVVRWPWMERFMEPQLRTIDIKTEIWHRVVCPHIAVVNEDIRHYDWISTYKREGGDDD